jgi:hypothetical protein
VIEYHFFYIVIDIKVDTTLVDKNTPKNRNINEANIVIYSLYLLFLLLVNLFNSTLKTIIVKIQSNINDIPTILLFPKKYIVAIKKGNPIIKPPKKFTILIFNNDTSL